MKILVCLKQIEHTYSRTGMDPDLNFLCPDDRIYRINPYDEAALELALRLKDNHKNIEIILLTMGELIAEKELRRCFATGADEFYQVDAKGNPDSQVRSKIIAETANMLGVDMVLCGKESLDRRNGQIPAYAANMLGYPFVSSITELNINQQTAQASVLRSCGKGARERITCAFPALFSVDLGKIDLRIPTHEKLLKAESANLRKLNLEGINQHRGAVLKKECPPLPRTGKVRSPDYSHDAYQRINTLLKGSITEKKGKFIEGTLEEQVNEIIDFLMNYSFIETPPNNDKTNLGK